MNTDMNKDMNNNSTNSTNSTDSSLPKISKITEIFNKISSFLPKTASEENIIDITKAFSNDTINVTPIIKTILGLHIDFPDNILSSKSGHKYNELEFFQSNQDSNSTNNTKTNSNALFEKFNRTHTQIGKTLLQSIILEPSFDANEKKYNNMNELIN
jgi:hypothetical protein